jgi:hypothetical protein
MQAPARPARIEVAYGKDRLRRAPRLRDHGAMDDVIKSTIADFVYALIPAA